MADNEEMDLDSLLVLGGVDGTSMKHQGEDGDDYGMSLDDLLAMENSSLMDVMNLGDGGGASLVLDGPAPDAELHLATESGPEPTPEPALLPDPDVAQGRPTASQEDAPPIIELQLGPEPEPALDPEPHVTANQDRTPEEADEAVELLAFDGLETGNGDIRSGDGSQAVTGDEEQDLNLDFLDEESDLLPSEPSGVEYTALDTTTDQEEFQLPIISEIQGHDKEGADEEARPQIDLTSIFGDADEEDAGFSSSTSSSVDFGSKVGSYSSGAADDELSLFTVSDDEEMATDGSGDRGSASTNDDLSLLPAIDWNEDEDDAFVLPQVIPDAQDVHDRQLANTKDTISTDNDLELLFTDPEKAVHREVQAPTDTDLDDDYTRHYDSPRRSRKGIGLLAISSLALIGLAAGGFAAYSSNLFPSFGSGAGSTTSDSSTSTPGTETTGAADQEQSSTVAKSALTEQSFVAATKNLGAKTAASVPASKDAIDRAISDVDESTNDDTMSNLINEIVAATKSKSPAEATSNKGSQILSVKASKTNKGLVFVVTSTGEMDLSVTVNVDGQVFQFPVQSSTGIATFVYDEPAPASGGYAYVVTSGSQEVSAVRSY
ncbi:hypothetical protein [uncultured Rothia sp.]|uniref:hypothetical protein n=1 Tax=uncultured Rothia sp. TaxID=316088 RepID=UPI0028DC33EF|nr:hypothetical protein [uncultured Rothia sp.]